MGYHNNTWDAYGGYISEVSRWIISGVQSKSVLRLLLIYLSIEVFMGPKMGPQIDSARLICRDPC